MSGIISICCGCGSVRNQAGAWDRAADYRRLLPSNRLSHGICSACIERLYPELAVLMAERARRSAENPARDGAIAADGREEGAPARAAAMVTGTGPGFAGLAPAGGTRSVLAAAPVAAGLAAFAIPGGKAVIGAEAAAGPIDA